MVHGGARIMYGGWLQDHGNAILHLHASYINCCTVYNYTWAGSIFSRSGVRVSLERMTRGAQLRDTGVAGCMGGPIPTTYNCHSCWSASCHAGDAQALCCEGDVSFALAGYGQIKSTRHEQK